jgi:hypothetical protein
LWAGLHLGFLCTIEWSRPCPWCWIKCQVSPLGWARKCAQHNGQEQQGHSMTLSEVANSMIFLKKNHVQQTHFGYYYKCMKVTRGISHYNLIKKMT